jgi:hypothetical protein
VSVNYNMPYELLLRDDMLTRDLDSTDEDALRDDVAMELGADFLTCCFVGIPDSSVGDAPTGVRRDLCNSLGHLVTWASTHARGRRDVCDLRWRRTIDQGLRATTVRSGGAERRHLARRRPTYPKEGDAFWKYRQRREPKVIVMAPPCAPCGRWAAMGRIYHRGAWRASLNYYRPFAQFCAAVALVQLDDGLDFINEQPLGSLMCLGPEWKEVARHPGVVRGVIHQRAAGRKDARTGLPVKKASDIWASSYTLIRPLLVLKCPGPQQHPEHATLRGAACDRARVWPWRMATLMAKGVAARLRERRNATRDAQAFPQDAAPADRGATPSRGRAARSQPWCNC